MPDTPITAAEFARELLKKLDAERAAAKAAIAASREGGCDENANGIKHQSFGVKMEGGE